MMKLFQILLLLGSFAAGGVFAEETNTSLNVTNATNNGAVGAGTNSAAPTTFTIDGTTYEDVRWGRLTPATVTMYHRTGIATVPLASLPPDLQTKFGYDPEKAAAWQAKVDKSAAARLAAERKAAADRDAAEKKAADQKAAADKAAAAKANAEKQKTSSAASSTSTNAPHTIQNRAQQVAKPHPTTY